ncbi:MAG: flagellar assembly protein FliH [Gammaproteobacteria bacterium]
MSKILDGNSSGGCQTWQAPQLNNSATGTNSLRTRKQQSQIEQDAYEQGFTRGYQEGLEQGQHEISEHIEHLQSLMTTLATPLRSLDKQVVDELVDLSMAVARQMIRRELKTSPGEIVAVVKEALSLLPVTTGDVRLEMHPEDAALVRTALLPSDADAPWQIVDDPLLSRGGCRVSTNTSRIDATVENRINAAIAAVLGNEREVD